MDSLLESYLGRISKRLRRSLPATVAEEHLKEIGLHLSESIADQMVAGKSERAATIEAVRRMGSDVLVADGILRAHSKIGEMSVWRLARVPSLIVMLYCVVPVAMGEMRPVPEWLIPLPLYLPTCFVIFFSYACLRSRRVLVLPVAVAFAVGLIAFLIDIMAFSGFGYTARSHQEMRLMLRQNQSQIAMLQSQVERGANLKSAYVEGTAKASRFGLEAPQPERTYTSGSGPWLPVDQTSVTSRWVLQPASTVDVAVRQWTKHGDEYLTALKADMQNQLAIRRRLLSSRLDAATLVGYAGNYTLLVGVVWLGILIWNLAFLGFGWLYRRAVSRMWQRGRFA